ncbi:hypothetical protein VTL71DRAFT_5851 [Oculimacula yallundae]|uniref:Uncharacterized protein n=1 Tax=Oculimacula yallundae TaxID=86028 RepID=A0ABR4C0E2_9HELO
MSALSPSYA